MNVLEKILEEIEERFEYLRKADDACRIYAESDRNFEGMKYFQNLTLATDRAKGIVEEIIRSHMDEAKNTNVPSNDGWIPVEERLPEVPDGLADEYCPEFNVTIKGAEKATTLKYSWDGTWFDDNGNVYNVIAWQPLPEPYKSKKTIPAAGMDHIMSRFTKVE